MPHYKFKINELEYRSVDAFNLDDALDRAGIAKDSPYGLVEGDKFDENRYYQRSIVWKTLPVRASFRVSLPVGS